MPNTQRTVSQSQQADAFARGLGHAVRSTSALRTSENTAWSYTEPIATFDPERQGTILLSDLKYSVTTSKHIGMIRRAAETHGVPVEITAHDAVKRAARA